MAVATGQKRLCRRWFWKAWLDTGPGSLEEGTKGSGNRDPGLRQGPRPLVTADVEPVWR